MSRKQVISTGGDVEVAHEVFAELTKMPYEPKDGLRLLAGKTDETESKARFFPKVFVTHDGVPVTVAPGVNTIKVDGVDVPVPRELVVALKDVATKVYQVPDGQGGFIPMPGMLILSALQTLFGTEFEEDQAARLAEIQAEQ